MAGLVVKNNMSAISTLNTLNKNHSALSKSLAKVSSGMKINSAADDASGYAISERMRVQIRSLDQANKNTQNGSSMMKTAEGAVSSTVDILKTLKEKVIGAANDDKTDSDRLTIQKELNQSIDQIDDNALVTFNGKYLVDGSKNTIGDATYTALTNQKLAEDTNADTKLTALKNRNNESLEIMATDKVTVSYVSQGKTYSTTFQAGENNTLQTIFDRAEAIDSSSHIFAGKDNKSVYAANHNMSDVSQISTDTGYKAMTAEARSAEGFLADYGNAVNNLVNAAKTVINAANTLITAGNNESSQTYETTGLDAAGSQETVVVNSKAIGSVFGGQTVDNVADALKYIQDNSNYFANNVAGQITYVTGDQANANGYGNATGSVSYSNARTDTDVSAAFNALVAAVSAYNGYNIADASNSSNGASRIYSQDSSSGAIDTTTTKTSALAAFNALGDNAARYHDFAAASGFGSDTNGVSINELGVGGSQYFGQIDSTDMADNGAYASNSTGAVAGGLDEGLSVIGGSTVLSGRVMAMAAYASELNRTSLLENSSVGVAGSNDMVKTADGTKAITVTANDDGIRGQIAGFNISVSDSEGNVKKSVNASLDSWTETVRAQNKSADNAISLHVGAAANQAIKVGLTDMRSEALGLKGADGTKLNISTQTKANAAINVLDNALQKALDQQTTIGSVESRLEYTSSNLTTSSENVQASESTIRDADMAKEMTEYTKNNVLLQAAQSMLAQANQNSSAVLSLLQ